MLWYLWSRFLKMVPQRIGHWCAGVSGQSLERDMVAKLIKKSANIRQLKAELTRINLRDPDADPHYHSSTLHSLEKTLQIWEREFRDQTARCQQTRVPSWKIYLASK